MRNQVPRIERHIERMREDGASPLNIARYAINAGRHNNVLQQAVDYLNADEVAAIEALVVPLELRGYRRQRPTTGVFGRR